MSSYGYDSNRGTSSDAFIVTVIIALIVGAMTSVVMFGLHEERVQQQTANQNYQDCKAKTSGDARDLEWCFQQFKPDFS